jgi:hypothetical protein
VAGTISTIGSGRGGRAGSTTHADSAVAHAIALTLITKVLFNFIDVLGFGV